MEACTGDQELGSRWLLFSDNNKNTADMEQVVTFLDSSSATSRSYMFDLDYFDVIRTQAQLRSDKAYIVLRETAFNEVLYLCTLEHNYGTGVLTPSAVTY